MSYRIHCCECYKSVDGEMITGAQAYPHRQDLFELRFIRCPNCHNHVGVHKNSPTNKPKALGCIPTKEMREIRTTLHRLFDPIWQKKYMSRTAAYKALSEKMGYEFHIAETKNVQSLEAAIGYTEILRKEVMK